MDITELYLPSNVGGWVGAGSWIERLSTIKNGSHHRLNEDRERIVQCDKERFTPLAVRKEGVTL